MLQELRGRSASRKYGKWTQAGTASWVAPTSTSAGAASDLASPDLRRRRTPTYRAPRLPITPSTTWLLCAAGALAAGLWAVLVLRRDALRVRVAGLLAVMAALFAALDWPWREPRVDEQELIVQTSSSDSGSGSPELETRLAALDAAGESRAARIQRRGLPGGQDFATAVLATALRMPERAQLALVWDAPFAARVSLEGVAASAHRSAAPWPFPPEDLRVTLRGAARHGRPLAIEFAGSERLRREVLPSARLDARVRDEGGELVAELADAPLGEAAWPALEFVPTQAGTYALELTLAFGDGVRRLRAVGSVAVADGELAVLVLGAAGANLAAALTAQGLRVERAPGLPAELAPFAVIVATGPVAPSEVQRLESHVDGGGGLFLLGGESGAALPLAESALAALSPLVRVPAPPLVEPPPSGAEGGPGEAAGAGAAASAQAEAPPEPLGPPPGEASPDAAATPPRAVATERETRVGERVDGRVEHQDVALVLVFDNSGSMREALGVVGKSKLELAQQSARETAQLLESSDQLGLIAFGERAYTILPLADRPDAARIDAAIAGLDGSDFDTLIGAALQRAEQWLRTCRAPVKHVVVITDGELQDPGDAALGQATAKRIAQGGASVSVLLIAPGGFARSERLARIAELGRGRFVREDDGAAIPRFVASEVTRTIAVGGRLAPQSTPGEPKPQEARPDPASAAPLGPPPPAPPPAEPTPAPLEAEPESQPPAELRVVAVEDSPLLLPAPSGDWPTLTGIERVEASERAAVLLATVDGTPLLALMHHGLGRVAAFATGLDGAESAAWRAAPEFPAWLATWTSALPQSPASREGEPLALSYTPSPAGPGGEELDWLARAARSGEVTPLDALGLPAPLHRVVSRGLAPELSFALALALLALAVYEAVQRRRELR